MELDTDKLYDPALVILGLTFQTAGESGRGSGGHDRLHGKGCRNDDQPRLTRTTTAATP